MIGLGIFLTAFYVPGWTGATILPGWVILSVVLPFLLFRRIEMGPGHWLGLIFLIYASVSILWAPIWQQAVWDLWLTWILAFCFCLGAQYYDRRLWTGMALGLSVCSGFAVAQWFGYEPIFANNAHNGTGVYPGTYINPDMFGETACLISIALISERIYWPLILTIPAQYLTGSRTALVAYAAVIVFALWERWRWVAVIPCLTGILGMGWLTTMDTTDRPGHHYAIAERFALWQDTAAAVTLRGHGAGSFFMLYPKFAKRTDTMTTRPEDPHNEYLNLAFQYGLGAIPVLALIALGFATRDPLRYVLVAFVTIAFFSFPSRIPTEGFVGMVALGRLCSRRNLAWLDELAGRSLDAARQVLQGRRYSAVEQIRSHEGGI